MNTYYVIKIEYTDNKVVGLHRLSDPYPERIHLPLFSDELLADLFINNNIDPDDELSRIVFKAVPMNFSDEELDNLWWWKDVTPRDVAWTTVIGISIEDASTKHYLEYMRR